MALANLTRTATTLLLAQGLNERSHLEAEMENEKTPIILASGEGVKTSMRGGVQTVKVPSEEVDGSFGYWESTIKGGPGLHIHHSSVECFYVLEGEVDFRLGDQQTRIGQGGFVLIPKGAVHAFSTVGENPAKLLVLMSPGGFEHWFDELAKELESSDGDYREVLKATGKKFDTEFLD